MYFNSNFQFRLKIQIPIQILWKLCILQCIDITTPKKYLSETPNLMSST